MVNIIVGGYRMEQVQLPWRGLSVVDQEIGLTAY